MKHDASQVRALPAGSGGAQAEAGVDPVRMVLDALSGRIVLAAVAGIVLAVCFASAGLWFGGQQINYASTGLIRIVPARPVILYRTEFNEQMPAYESYRLAQARYIRSQRLLDWALQDDELRTTGWPTGPGGLAALQASLQLDVPRDEEMIVVSVTNPSPDVARVATDAVLRAYERLAIDTAAQEFASLEQELVRLRDRYRRERDEAREEILRLAEQHGTDDLVLQRNRKHYELQSLDSRILDIELAIAERESIEGVAPAADEQPEDPEVPSNATADAEIPVESLALRDETLAGLVQMRNNLRLRISTLRETLGPRHPHMLRTNGELRAVEDQIEARADELRAMPLAPVGASGMAVAAGRSLPELRAELARFESIREELAEAVLSLGRTQLRIDHERQLAEEAANQLAETSQRLEALRVEQGESRVARAEIVQRAERPIAPVSDKRRQFAAAGLVGGFGMGVGLVALPGLIWPRFRMVRHVAGRSAEFRLLGVIPQLSENPGSADEMMQANLRQIANAVESEVLRDPGHTSIYAVTSAAAGEGKTSLTSSIAGALARHGRRVLVIAADPQGRALTDQFGFSGRPGLQEVVSGDTSITTESLPSGGGFTILPSGNKPDALGRSMGPQDFAAVLDRFAPAFEIVLVDTGPLLGSPEAAAVAVNANHVILVVSRGQDQNLVRAARDRLSQIGVSSFGVVFNRASRSDVERDPSSVSMSRASVRPDGGVSPGRLALMRAAGLTDEAPDTEHAA